MRLCCAHKHSTSSRSFFLSELSKGKSSSKQFDLRTSVLVLGLNQRYNFFFIHDISKSHILKVLAELAVKRGPSRMN